MDIFPKNFKFGTDAAADSLLNHLKGNAESLGLHEASLFCEFPMYRTDDEVYLSKLLIVSPLHGVLIIGSYSGTYDAVNEGLNLSIAQTESIYDFVYSKLIKSQALRSSRTALSFAVDVAIFALECPKTACAGETTLLTSVSSFPAYLKERARSAAISGDTMAEILSIIEGSKGLIRARERKTAAFAPNSKVALVKSLEEEIRRFDREQRTGYMTDVYGPQRITGLAGSGKTVVLAMKAALAHLKNPDAKIAFTFYTKSLYQHVKQLITRFYRQFDDRDPDWDNLRILHAWGGAINEGLYHYSARALGVMPLNFAQAKALNPRQPFDFACTTLLDSAKGRPLFDYIFVDEAQDFPPSFLRLVLCLAAEEKLVIAYDVFQTIFDVDIPTAGTLFGTNESGEPAVVFEEDIVLHKCYRNPLEILVCAHAIGFGLYSNQIVQMLESEEHWKDFGYVLESGELHSGNQVSFSRPAENSPSSISSATSPSPVIEVTAHQSLAEEVDHVVSAIHHDIKFEGLQPDDILIICADDLNSRGYRKLVLDALSAKKIEVNDLQEKEFALRDFFQRGKVTFATTYKAKGNEAVEVFVLGVDALFHLPNARSRNTIFTAMTRAKGYLRVSGMGPAAQKFKAELERAIANVPRLTFKFPDQTSLLRIRRDLSEDTLQKMEDSLGELERNLSPNEMESLLMSKLREVRRKRLTSGKLKMRSKR